MTDKEEYKLSNLCYECKKGYSPTAEEHKFLSEMYKKFPDRYEKIQKDASQQAMNEVNPFGEIN
ncbi:MAG: hypothetical protein J7L15_07255 [Clostridiales bacterium]|nr:hypothetical protein [Clostridiales bacterium]